MFTLFAILCVASCVRASFNPSDLYPITLTSGFSTAPSGSGPSFLNYVALDDSELQVINVTKFETHQVVPAPSAPPNTMAWEAIYPEGSWNPSDSTVRGGFGFYFAGPESFDVTSVNELLFSYAVYFPKSFQFNMGGKLPGPYGGTSIAEALQCSGGRQQDRSQCFDLRLMWRTNGAGEIYAYLPESPANDVLNQLTGTVTDDTFGTSIARGAFTWATGSWTVVAQRVKLNTPGASTADGELELFVNGKSVIHATQVLIRESEDSVFRGIHAETFFGGDTEDWASPVNQSAFFADMSAGGVQPGASPAEKQGPYPLGNSAQSQGPALVIVTGLATLLAVALV